MMLRLHTQSAAIRSSAEPATDRSGAARFPRTVRRRLSPALAGLCFGQSCNSFRHSPDF
jgi:hypothetical protein